MGYDLGMNPLRKHINETGATVTFLAKKAKLDRSGLSQILNEIHKPSLETKVALSEATDGKIAVDDWN